METRFRLFRSRMFWLGVPGVVFLLWLWSDSMKWTSAVGHTSFGAILTEPGLVQVTITSESERKYVTPSFRSRRNRIEDSPESLFPKSYGKLISGSPGEDTYIVVPIWKLIVLHCGLWWSMVLWRWLRFKRALLEMPAG